MLTEQAYAIDMATGGISFLGDNIERKYQEACKKLYRRELRVTEIPLTLDVEATHKKTGQPCALDWKSGQYTKPARELWQMKLQSYVLAVKYDAPSVLSRVVYIEPKGNVWIDEHVFNRMELDLIPGEVLAIMNRVAQADGSTVYSGDWCKFCPALLTCPATTALAPLFITDLEGMTSGTMTLAHVGKAKAKLTLIEGMAKKAKERLNAIINEKGEVPADDGYVWRSTEQSKAYFDAAAARGLLVQLGATDAQLAKLSSKTSTYPVIRRSKKKED